jgi:hypothetical protein
VPIRLRETWAATGIRLPLVTASWLVRREYLVTVRPTDAGVLPRPRSGARWSRIQDPSEWPGDPAPALEGPAEIQHRLDQGQECWVAWIDGEPAHWRWEIARSVFLPYLGKTLCLGPRDYGVVDVYTAPPGGAVSTPRDHSGA